MPTFDQPSGSLSISWQDFARERSESEYPELWEGLEGFWCAGLGPTGLVLFNVGPQHKDRQAGAFVNLDGNAWGPMLTDGRTAIDFFHNSSSGHINCGVGLISEERGEITIGGYIALDSNRGSVGDWRLLSRAAATGEGSHRYMIGSSNGTNFRTRLSIAGSVETDVTNGNHFTRGENIMAAATYSQDTVRHWKNAVQINSFSYSGAMTPNQDAANSELYLGANKNGSTGSSYGTMDAMGYSWFVYNRALQQTELLLLTQIPHAPLVRRAPKVYSFVPAVPSITPGEIAAATGPKRHDVDLPPAEVVAY